MPDSEGPAHTGARSKREPEGVARARHTPGASPFWPTIWARMAAQGSLSRPRDWPALVCIRSNALGQAFRVFGGDQAFRD